MNLLESLGLSSDFAHKSLKAVAALGSYGRYPNNIASEFLTWLGDPGFPPPLKVEINALITKPRSRASVLRQVPFHFLLPHYTFSHFFHNRRQHFDYKMLGIRKGADDNTVDRVQYFWQELIRRRDIRLKRHPVCKRSGWEKFAVPVAIHGDAIPVIMIGKPGTKSLDCLSWQSLLASGTTLSIKELMFCIFEANKKKCCPHDQQTETAIWRVLMWSFKALYNGKHPDKDWNDNDWPSGSSEALLAGKPLCSDAEPYFAVIFSIKGDIDWYGKGLGLKKHSANLCCDFCPCDKKRTQTASANNFFCKLWMENATSIS